MASKDLQAELATSEALSRRLTAIRKGVMGRLGKPDDLQRVHVSPLWEDHFRVNILVGADAITATVAHSFFLVADGEGAIVASTPDISRRY